MERDSLEEGSIWPFLVFTLLLGGWAAWMTGRATAITWRPYGMLIPYLLILAAAVRFFHYALFQGTLLSLHYLCDRCDRRPDHRLARLPLQPDAPDDDPISLAVRANGPVQLASETGSA